VLGFDTKQMFEWLHYDWHSSAGYRTLAIKLLGVFPHDLGPVEQLVEACKQVSILYFLSKIAS